MINGVEHRYPAHVREFCLQITYFSQRAYKYFRRVFNNKLPDLSTIRAWYARSDYSSPPGINTKILERLAPKVAEKEAMGSKLACSLSVDEMAIRRHIQWNKNSISMMGLPTFENKAENDTQTLQCARQAIVFMLCGVNERFQLQFAYHFVKSLNGEKRGELLKAVYEEVSKTGIRVLNVTSDGYSANESMCVSLKANFKINSRNYKPFIDFDDGNRVYVIKDAPHMLELVRNTLAGKMHLKDDDGNDIKCESFQELVTFGESNMFDVTHKLSQKHLQWDRRIMKVDIAAQTLSNKTANAFEYPMSSRTPEFENVEGEITFIRWFDKLFDVFNTKTDSGHENMHFPLKIYAPSLYYSINPLVISKV